MSTTTEQTSLYVPGATATSTQWRLSALQVVNWGNFSGHHVIDIHPEATLITGASGAGKSTLLDAYTAVMMGSDIAFNGASNQARGRIRGTSQRNLVSYIRGQWATTDDEGTGSAKAKVLRGADRVTWSAVAVTFSSVEGGQHYTVIRAWIAKPKVTLDGDLIRRIWTLRGQVDLSVLEPLVKDGFDLRTVREALPGVVQHDTYDRLVTALETNVGLGSNGNGRSAMKMLARVQASAQLENVDALYKTTVLDKPATFAEADAALAHYDELDGAYRELEKEGQRRDHLLPMREHHDKLEHAAARIAAHDTASWGDPHGPAALWQAQVTEATAQAAEDHANIQLRQAATRLQAATERKQLADSARDDAAIAFHTSGGEAAIALKASIGELERSLTRRETALRLLAARLSPLGLPLGSTQDLLDATSRAAEGLSAAQDRVGAQQELLGELGHDAKLAEAAVAEASEELAHYQRHRSRIDPRLDRLRRELAHAAGLDPAELPFVAELLDLAPGQQEWRTAVEVVLTSSRHVVVDAATAREFSTRINEAQLSGRIAFLFADPDQPMPPAASPRTVAGKLVHKDGPWAGWLARHLSESPAGRTVCVRDPRELGEHASAVTLTGQTRGRGRGAHGRDAGRKDVIGFSNEADIEQAQQRLERERARAATLVERRNATAAQVTELRKQADAWSRLADLDVIEHDPFATAIELERVRGELAQLLTGDVELAKLQARVEETKLEADAAAREHADAERVHEQLVNEHAGIVSAKDAATDRVIALERDNITIDPELAEHLERLLANETRGAAPRTASAWAALGESLQRVQQLEAAGVEREREELARATRLLEQAMSAYQERWPDPNLGTDLLSCGEYLALLERIEGSGLADKRQAWRNKLLEWTGRHLVKLYDAMDSAIYDIKDRLEPVNDVLHHLEFGPNGDRLVMQMRRLTSREVTDFRATLRKHAQMSTSGLDEKALAAWFLGLGEFMDGLREGARRERVLDVRQHVEIRAEQRSRTTDELVATHTSLAAFSGGETQEVGAFIAGAALRYRLGDDGQARPRFAPVLIDEAFIKADGEFTGRAVAAWLALGFQLVIGCPLEKVSGIERAVPHIVVVTKNQRTNLGYPHVLDDDTTLEQARAGAGSQP